LTMTGTLKGALIAACFSSVHSFAWTNDKITTCARDGRASGVSWLTANNASYVCTNEQWDKYYDPAYSIAYFALNDDATAPATATCPNAQHELKCVIFASWGQVAGGPDACTDTCSTNMLTGAGSCCGKACTSAGQEEMSSPPAVSPTASAANCTNNKWVSGVTSQCGSTFAGGYCDCCPNCFDCVHPPPPSKMQAKSFVANRFCDCRKGLEVASDYSPCWNSCLDCLGDDGQVQYMTEDVAEFCIGKAECSVKVEASTRGNYWYKCSSKEDSSCTKSSQASGTVPQMPKAKGAMLCGPASDISV